MLKWKAASVGKTMTCNYLLSVFEPEGSENEEEYKKIHEEYKNMVS